MAVTPESLPDNAVIDFRAPPPSPIASGRQSSVRNEEVLSEFLEHSLKVPDLILPDRVFPRQKSIQNPPKLDLDSFESLPDQSIEKLIDSVARIGCFEVVNHGLERDLIKSVMLAGDGIFSVSPEKRKLAMRTLERPFGFEEVHGEDERETGEDEFIWFSDEEMKKAMEGIWPMGYSNFSEKMEKLLMGIEEVGRRILGFLMEQKPWETKQETEDHRENYGSTICYIHKHSGIIKEDYNSLRYDVIRMLIKGSEFPHALCLHICNGAEEFHVYSKKGWVSFHPDEDSLVITIGDTLQRGSGGIYKHVIGKPIFKGIDHHKPISMAFLYSPIEITNGERNHNGHNISIIKQIVIAIILTLLYHLIVFVYQSL